MNIEWDEKLCIHSGTCVQTLPNVFKIENGKFVIEASQEDESTIINTVNKCPSGALRITQ